jgi:hypothetical protein
LSAFAAAWSRVRRLAMPEHAAVPAASLPADASGAPSARRAGAVIATAATLLVLALPAAASAAAPTITPETLWNPTPTSIQLNELVNPQGEPLTDCHFLWGEGSSLDHEVTCEGTDESQTVALGYPEAGQFRLTYEGQQTADLAFDASALDMQAALEALPAIGSGQVSISGGQLLPPYFDSRTYVVTFTGSLAATDVPQITGEDGTEPLSGSLSIYTNTPGGSALEIANSNPSGDFRATARLAGLTPNTEYSFRLLATNAAGTEQGEIRSFTTLEEPASAACPNQAFRDNQQAGYLPDCRAYEMATPLEKGHGDIVADGATTVASRFGGAVAFNSRIAFGDTVGSGTVGQTQYVARRTDQGWEVHAITPMPQPEALQTFAVPTLLQLYSDDLRTAVVRGYDLPDARDEWPSGWPPRNNIYVEDTATRDLQTVTLSQVDEPQPFDFISYPYAQFWGFSADARHVAFVTSTQFLPDAAPEKPNVYKWDDGVLSVASILPNGTVAPNGANTPTKLRGAMSADGSRLLFTTSTGGPAQLFLQIDDSPTAWVSQTELDPSDPRYQLNPASVQPLGMTPDGKNVFFTTRTPLLPEDGDSSGIDLYRYTDSADPSNEDNLTLISQERDFGNGGELMGISDDGERVYYRAAALITLWDHGATSLISSTTVSAGQFRLTDSAPGGYARVSPDGMFVAFSVIDANEAHGLTGEVTNGHRQFYLYSLANDTLSCVSCPPGGASADATVLPAATDGLNLFNAGFRSRFLSDGGRVFFSTADALLPEDTNGVLDAYEYDPLTGRVSLLSSGTGDDPSTFADASAGADDVFIVTREPLTKADGDELVDLYDVRTGGGFPEPVVPPVKPCSEERCQGSQGVPPDVSTPGSDAVGPGNPTPPRRPCRKRRHHRHAKPHKRCGRRHSQQRRNLDRYRRAGR